MIGLPVKQRSTRVAVEGVHLNDGNLLFIVGKINVDHPIRYVSQSQLRFESIEILLKTLFQIFLAANPLLEKAVLFIRTYTS
jgi:hypothetical protein